MRERAKRTRGFGELPAAGPGCGHPEPVRHNGCGELLDRDAKHCPILRYHSVQLADARVSLQRYQAACEVALTGLAQQPHQP
ncbi:MAG: hypothetical protein ACRDKL_01505, partial [Solirubrobacteraceae bacterium]